MEEMYDYLGRLQIKRVYFTVASFCAAIFYAQNPRDTKPCLWDFLSFSTYPALNDVKDMQFSGISGTGNAAWSRKGAVRKRSRKRE